MSAFVFGKDFISTPSIDRGIHQLDRAYTARGLTAEISSGLRTFAHQIEVIEGLALAGGVPIGGSDMLAPVLWEDGLYYLRWQIVWSRLMNLDYDVNPPKDAKLLLSRWVGGINKKGKIYPASEHILGVSFDVEGEMGGKQMLDEYTEALVDSMTAGEVPSITGFTKETKNNCLHINCRNVDLATNESDIPSVA